jgi:hypothetical protein
MSFFSIRKINDSDRSPFMQTDRDILSKRLKLKEEKVKEGANGGFGVYRHNVAFFLCELCVYRSM